MRLRKLLVPALALAIAVMPAAAQGEDVTADTEVSASVVYAHPVSESAPTQATGIANPSIICLFMACPPELSEPLYVASNSYGVTEPVHGNSSPMQPLPPDSVAVGLLNGSLRYESALQFELPALPEGQEYSSFTVTFTQTDPTYHSSSPAFRQAVDGAFIIYRDEDPEKAAAAFEQALTAAPVEDKVLDVQACPLNAPFEPVDAPATASSDDIPTDEYGAPQMACHLGSFGSYDPDTATWTFDLTRAANTWAVGDLANNGLFLQPFRANYLGIGDEDPSTHAQVTLDATAVTIRATTTEASGGFFVPPPPPIVPAAPAAEEQNGTDVGSGSQGNEVPAPAVTAVPLDPAPGEAPVPAPAPEAAPAPAAVPAPSGSLAGSLATEEIPDGLRVWALVILLAAGAVAQQVTVRGRPKPVRVDRAVTASPSA